MPPLPDVHFGDATVKLPDWRKRRPDRSMDDDSDNELLVTPSDVISLLGFDPKDTSL